MDKLSKAQRSFTMSRIRSKWTTPEKITHNFLKSNKIKHKMHPKLKGSPDVVLKEKKIAIFIHGCFWHGCKKCYKKPESNKKYWESKIRNNKKRDKTNSNLLRTNKWKILTIWEHSFKKTKISHLKKKIKKLTYS